MAESASAGAAKEAQATSRVKRCSDLHC